MLRTLAILAAVLGIGFFLVKWKWYPGPPIPTGVLSPVNSGGHREWNKMVFHYPGFPVRKDYREWSHWEIAQRHKALVLRDLPDYITELRGCGAEHETTGTDAAWFFVVPREHLPEFEQYILDLGVLREALHDAVYIELPVEYHDWNLHPSAEPVHRLLFGTSMKTVADGAIMNMQLGKSSGAMDYYLVNPNLSRATVRIIVGWANGNVQFYEKPVNPDDD